MTARLISFLLVLTFIPSFAQESEVKIHHRKFIGSDYIPQGYDKSVTLPANRLYGGQPIGLTTTYNLFANCIIRDQIAYFNDTIHFANMIRPWGGIEDRRVIAWTTFDGNNFSTPIAVFDDTYNSGWPHIDIAYTDPDLAGTIAITGHHSSVPSTSSKLAIWTGGSDFIVSQFSHGIDPSVQFIGENIYLANSGNVGRDQFQFFVTNDLGASFTNFDSIYNYHPSPIYWLSNGGVEVGMSKSRNKMHFGYFGTNEGNGHVYDGVPENGADNIWLIYSTDGGATWPGFAGSIGFDGIINSVSGYHTPNYAPLFENFGQIDAAVGNNGIWHVVANGYGLVFDDEVGSNPIGSSFPVIYWNSDSNEWISISDEAIDTIQDIANYYYYPGYSLGQAYPSVSVSENGQVVYVVWTGPQLDGNGNLDIVECSGSYYYWRDLYHVWSFDGGNTWEYGGVLSGETEISEAYGHAAQHLEFIPPNTYRAHIVYLADLTLNSCQTTDNPIMYLTHDLKVTSIDDNSSFANSFELEQNFPNPFNPNTMIKYKIAEQSNVTLKIYDILGKEVATLVNEEKPAGVYTVNFDASDIASGIYFYSISATPVGGQAGNFSETKKMILLR